LQVAQEVDASQDSAALSSSFSIVVVPRPGHTVEEMQTLID
jgi:hypothetical protein